MNTETEKMFSHVECRKEWARTHRRGKIAGGIVIVTAGILFFLKRAGVEFPDWVLSWKMLLIGFGFIAAIKHGFKKAVWIIPVIIGAAFIIADHVPNVSIGQFIWPVVIIMLGLFVIFKPRRNFNRWHRYYHRHGHHHRHHQGFHWTEKGWDKSETTEEKDDYMDASNVFGGFRKHVVSKNFKGGELTNFFGGGELNLTQADISGKVSLEITAIFGGVKLVVPRNWDIQSEITTFCGGIDDKRQIDPNVVSPEKILVLKGNAVFGGIEIVSY
jgi:predicted membrane protein